MERELTLDQQIEVINLRVKRRKLLAEETKTERGTKTNLHRRIRVSAKLFELTRNPIYIHF
jgi:hypothetical protein